ASTTQTNPYELLGILWVNPTPDEVVDAFETITTRSRPEGPIVEHPDEYALYEGAREQILDDILDDPIRLAVRRDSSLPPANSKYWNTDEGWRRKEFTRIVVSTDRGRKQINNGGKRVAKNYLRTGLYGLGASFVSGAATIMATDAPITGKLIWG